MTESLVHFWSWLVQFFGPIGATLILIIAAIVTLSGCLIPFYVQLLHRRIKQIEQQLAEVTATQNRQHQVDRLQCDRARKRPRRRRS